jgi:hypothetical protein
MAHVYTVLLSLVLSLFSTAVMSYIAMAIPIGPWIETTLVLIAMLLTYVVSCVYRVHNSARAISLATMSGAIGGILATGISFSLPMLYFLEKDLFLSWLESPLYFSSLLSLCAFASGAFGLVVAHIFEYRLIVKDALAFPIGQVVYKMISAQAQFYKALQLAGGFITTQFFLYLQYMYRLIPCSIVLVKKTYIDPFIIPFISVQTDLFPMLIAIGFITGHMIAIPLGVGIISKMCVMSPLYYFYGNESSFMDFTIAFSTGVVLYGASIGMVKGLPRFLKKYTTRCILRPLNSLLMMARSAFLYLLRHGLHFLRVNI